MKIQRKLNILLSIFILMAVLLAACGSGQATDIGTPTLDQTMVADVVAAAQTQSGPEATQPPDPTSTPPATDTPTAAPTLPPVEGDPLFILGEPDGVDEFNTAGNWTLFDNECFRSEISDGYFLMTAQGSQGSLCWEVSWPLLENFYLETMIIMPEVCDPADRFGVLFRAPDNNQGYLYGITCSGLYSLTKWDGNQTTVLLEPTQDAALLIGANQPNRLGLMAFGDDYYLYANGRFLDETKNEAYLDPGKIGYFVNPATDQSFTVKYDYLKVWLLHDQYYPPEVTPPTHPEVPVEPPQSDAATVTATANVNVRSGPGMQFPVLGVADKGTTGEVAGISPDGYWWAVKVPTTVSGNGLGWVSGKYTQLSNPSGAEIPTIPPPLLPPTVYAPPPSSSDPQVTMTDHGVIRSGPGLEYPVYGITSVGSKAIVSGISEDGDWWAIVLSTSTAPDGTGWVYKSYVSAKNVSNVPVIPNPSLPNNVTPAAPDSGAAAAITIEPVNIRSGPGNVYPSYGKVPIGSIMAVIGVSPDKEFWVVKVPSDIAPDERGWVPARYCHAQNTSNVPIIQPPPPP
jgi:uncharacterized protein YraI